MKRSVKAKTKRVSKRDLFAELSEGMEALAEARRDPWSQVVYLVAASAAPCYQIRILDKRRLTETLVVIDDEDLRRSILDGLRFQLGI